MQLLCCASPRSKRCRRQASWREECSVCRCCPGATRRYFARVAEERMGPDDAAILVTHAPLWLSAWCAPACLCPTNKLFAHPQAALSTPCRL